jgi:anaerobic ribonucleoside-triphosphate reductase activating protein
MGGDSEVNELRRLFKHVKDKGLKTCWYSGRETCPIETDYLDYLKLGSYIKKLGGLDSPDTNQRFYQVSKENGLIDMTFLFQR